MKKVIASVLILFLLCGCKGKRSVIWENGRFLVATIGVDIKSGEVLVSCEAVVVNSEDTEQPPKTVVYEGKGKEFLSAMKRVSQKSPKPLDYSHCALILFGESLSENVKNEVFDYCLNNSEITVSVGFAQTKNANKLLKLEPVSDIAIGYEMAVMLETQYNQNKRAFNNRFFEIENARRKGQSIKLLPEFTVKDKTFYLEGEKN